MPVMGLPSMLESMLNSALEETTVSSFKIEGRGNQTVFILRLTPTISTRPPVNQEHSAAFKRKCPSQVARDKRRAEAHRTRQENQASGTSPSGLFLPTPPSLFYNDEQNDTVGRNADVFSFSPCIPSTPVYSSDVQQDEQGVQMTQCDTDTQTVTLCIDEDAFDEVSCADKEAADLCESEMVDDVKEKSVTDVECVDSETDHVGAFRQGSDIYELQQMTLPPGVTYNDIMAFVQKFGEEYQKHMDDVHKAIKEVKTACSDVKGGNPSEDVP